MAQQARRLNDDWSVIPVYTPNCKSTNVVQFYPATLNSTTNKNRDRKSVAKKEREEFAINQIRLPVSPPPAFFSEDEKFLI